MGASCEPRDDEVLDGIAGLVRVRNADMPQQRARLHLASPFF
jgi:hypothetical protein